MLSLILISPLFGFVSGCLFGYRLGFGVCFITTSAIGFAFFNSLILFYNTLALKTVYKVNLGKWIFLNAFQVDWYFSIDSLTAIMLLVVTFISFLVHLYSIEYMEHDPHLPRFMSYLALFTFFMLILITANNFLQLFLGWEGVGLSSFLLINFWFTRIQANKAAIKAMLINRVGDFFLLIAIFLIYTSFGTLNYDIIFCLAPFFKDFYFNFSGYYVSSLNIICLCLFLGAMGKSAQIGLHVWLPDAMEGPTPVSALIHAATMVTAGIFLIIRCSFFFEYAPNILKFVGFIGALTAFFAASTGLFQNDIKKTIAYSTCSQLGYMIFACGLSAYDVAIFHLYNHAFFKALLFLGSGSIIHAVSNEQDMRKMGALKYFLPFSYSVILIGSLALIGFPFLTGFYSKDLILESAYAQQTFFSYFSYILGSISAFFTAFYSTRLLFMVFLSEPNGNKHVILNAHEASYKMGLPLFVLGILSVLIGYVSKDLFVGMGTPFWDTAIFIKPENILSSDSEFISYFYKILPLLFTLFGTAFSIILYVFNLNIFFKSKQNKFSVFFFNFLVKKWYFDKFYNIIFGLNILNFSYKFSYQDIDRGFMEFFGPATIVNSIQRYYLSSKSVSFLFFTKIFSFFVILFIYTGLYLLNFVVFYKILIPIFILLTLLCIDNYKIS